MDLSVAYVDRTGAAMLARSGVDVVTAEEAPDATVTPVTLPAT